MRTLRRFLLFRQNQVAVLIIGLYVFVALAAPLLAPPPNPEQVESYRLLEGVTDPTPLPPGPDAPLGTVIFYSRGVDGAYLLHFDVYYSLIWGTREVLRFALVTVLLTALLGVLIGAVSGYLGGPTSRVAMRIADAFLAFPVIAGVGVLQTVLVTLQPSFLEWYGPVGPRTELPPLQQLVLDLQPDPLMLALVLFTWMPYARIINALMTRLRGAEYVLAARAVGAGHGRLIFRHMLPNAISPAIVLAARDIGTVVILQAAFAFTGVVGTTTSSAIPEWDRLLLLGKDWVIGVGGNPLTYWWLYVPVTLALIIFGVGWNLLGDGLNMALDPRARARYG